MDLDNLRFVMDETSAPYEPNENPFYSNAALGVAKERLEFPQTEEDKEFEKMIIEKYHLITKEMEEANHSS